MSALPVNFLYSQFFSLYKIVLGYSTKNRPEILKKAPRRHAAPGLFIESIKKYNDNVFFEIISLLPQSSFLMVMEVLVNVPLVFSASKVIVAGLSVTLMIVVPERAAVSFAVDIVVIAAVPGISSPPLDR